MMYVALLLLLPVVADTPTGHSFYEVDCIVYNRVISVNEEHDEWGRTRYTTSEQHWISFWDHRITWNGTPLLWCPFVTDRGWCTAGMARIVPCSRGWMVVTGHYSVTAPMLLVIESDHDWELRNRRFYQPIR